MKKNSLGLGLFAALALIPTALLAQEAPKPTAKKAEPPVLCVVRGSVIADPSKAPGKFEVDGKTYHTCCNGCKAKFEKADPKEKAKLVKITDLRTEKMVLQQRLEALDAELKSLTEPAKPAASTTVPAKLYCAMTDEEIASANDAAGGKSEYKGKTYYFCCPSCKKTFDTDPAKYAAQADEREARRKN